MNYQFTSVLNKIKIGLKSKKRQIKVKYSSQNMEFLYFLLKLGYIASIIKKGKILVILLKYEGVTGSVISAFSITSKISSQRPVKSFSNKSSNFLVNLMKEKKKYSRLVARFR